MNNRVQHRWMGAFFQTTAEVAVMECREYREIFITTCSGTHVLNMWTHVANHPTTTNASKYRPAF